MLISTWCGNWVNIKILISVHQLLIPENGPGNLKTVTLEQQES